MYFPSPRPRRSTPSLLLLSGFLIACTSSCKLLTTAVNAPGKVASTVLGGSPSAAEKRPPSLSRADVMRFADNFAARITHATQEFANKAATPDANIQALGWSVGQSTSAFTIAAGPNANVALLDMIVLVTVGRMTHEEYWMPKVWGEADRPLLEAFQEAEKEVWQVAALMLDQQQQDDLRATLREWRERNPDMSATVFARLPAFEDILKARAEAGAVKENSLANLFSVDPLAGLEPAVREIERSRLFAERTLYYAQRMPQLLSTQVELLGLKLMRMPEIHSALADSQRFSQAAANFADTATKLSEEVRVEREAAVKQISAALTLQREGLVADLEKSEAPARKILDDARTTLEASTRASAALQGTIDALDTFMSRFDKREKKPGEAQDSNGTPAQAARPFDVTEYGDAAAKLGTAAHELNGLVSSFDQNLPKIQHALDEAAQRGTLTIDHAFQRGLQLGALLIAAAALAALLVRWISVRFVCSAASRRPTLPGG